MAASYRGPRDAPSQRGDRLAHGTSTRAARCRRSTPCCARRPGQRAAAIVGRPVLKRSPDAELDEVRAARGERAPSPRRRRDPRGRDRAARRDAVIGLTPVINATGVMLHTNLGRAPLAAPAVAPSRRAADRLHRPRGRPHQRRPRVAGGPAPSSSWRRSPSAEAALVVNNCAAALVLTLAALAKGKKVLVSRGELIEIGGEFRIPDIMRASGARLVEVGTTNRTRLADYRDRAGRSTGRDPEGASVELPRGRLHARPRRRHSSRRSPARPTCRSCSTWASGLLDAERGFPGDEPTVHRRLADGADLVTFSGDKLLGGPQAGCIVGRADLIAQAPQAPARARDADRQAPGRRARGDAGAVRDRRARRGPRPPDDPRARSTLLAKRAHSPVRGDRWRPRGRARRAVRVGRRRRLAAGSGARRPGACG